ncbi:hypothetical protein BDR06DRAFT_967033 [Suillus hirtellus]|nr:hypothetical protein BDR06DRAFT_967033 [Suillus hirtellus]
MDKGEDSVHIGQVVGHADNLLGKLFVELALEWQQVILEFVSEAEGNGHVLRGEIHGLILLLEGAEGVVQYEGRDELWHNVSGRWISEVTGQILNFGQLNQHIHKSSYSITDGLNLGDKAQQNVVVLDINMCGNVLIHHMDKVTEVDGGERERKVMEMAEVAAIVFEEGTI